MHANNMYTIRFLYKLLGRNKNKLLKLALNEIEMETTLIIITLHIIIHFAFKRRRCLEAHIVIIVMYEFV
jgi:hypothetical protein